MNKIISTNVDKNGKVNKSKYCHPGECVFPFRYRKKMVNKCQYSKKTGGWCATSLKENGTYKTFGYCPEKKYQSKKKSPRVIIRKLKSRKRTKGKVAVENKTPDMNQLIISELNIMRNKEFARNDTIRVIAYSKAIKIIRENFQNIPITSGEELQKYKGIGKKIVAKVNEIISTGKLSAADKVRNDPGVQAINLFAGIHGIGAKKARDIVIKLKITSIKELREKKDDKQSNGRALLNKVQQLGLKYYEDSIKRIPRSEMNKHHKLLLKVGQEINKKFNNTQLTVVGSYRRQKKDCGDIDVLITNKDNNSKVFNILINKLIEIGYISDTFAHGKKKYMGMCRLNSKLIYRRLDILYTSPEEYPFALLYFTGSGSFNTTLRDVANERGYRLNEYGLKHYNIETRKVGGKIDHEFKSETDIFTFFGLPYIEPENREPSTLNKLF